jgi:hypothetical protein
MAVTFVLAKSMVPSLALNASKMKEKKNPFLKTYVLKNKVMHCLFYKQGHIFKIQYL